MGGKGTAVFAARVTFRPASASAASLCSSAVSSPASRDTNMRAVSSPDDDVAAWGVAAWLFVLQDPMGEGPWGKAHGGRRRGLAGVVAVRQRGSETECPHPLRLPSPTASSLCSKCGHQRGGSSRPTALLASDCAQEGGWLALFASDCARKKGRLTARPLHRHLLQLLLARRPRSICGLHGTKEMVTTLSDLLRHQKDGHNSV